MGSSLKSFVSIEPFRHTSSAYRVNVTPAAGCDGCFENVCALHHWAELLQKHKRAMPLNHVNWLFAFASAFCCIYRRYGRTHISVLCVGYRIVLDVDICSPQIIASRRCPKHIYLEILVRPFDLSICSGACALEELRDLCLLFAGHSTCVESAHLHFTTLTIYMAVCGARIWNICKAWCVCVCARRLSTSTGNLQIHFTQQLNNRSSTKFARTFWRDDCSNGEPVSL